MKAQHVAVAWLVVLVAFPAAAQHGPWYDGGGVRAQQSADRDRAQWKKAREGQGRRDGDGAARLTPDQRDQLRRDLERANREIYHRKRRD